MFETDVTGCPAGTAINIGRIHKEVAGENGSVVVNSGLAAGELTLTGGLGKINKTQPTVDRARATEIITGPAGFYMNWHSTLNPRRRDQIKQSGGTASARAAAGARRTRAGRPS